LSEDIGIMPWSPLAGGFLSGKYTRKSAKAGNSRRDTFDFPPLNKEKAYDIIDVLEEMAGRYKVSVATVALNWVISQKGITSTIIGAKSLDQLNDNIKAVDLVLADSDMIRLNESSALSSEYPGWMVNRQLQGRWPE